MKKIIYTDKETNNFCLVTPSNKYIDNLKFVAERTVPEDCEYFIIDDQDLPKDSEFFDAFCIKKTTDGVSVVVDITKAKEIWLEHYRTARTPILEKLDLEYMMADEQGNLELKKEIASKKQALRDVTLTPLPDDLAGIKATWPEILN
jgi:hypothetical protein